MEKNQIKKKRSDLKNQIYQFIKSRKPEYFPFKLGDKIIQLGLNNWSFDKKGDVLSEPYMEITGVGRTLYFYVWGSNEHVGSKTTSYRLMRYNPNAKSIEDYIK